MSIEQNPESTPETTPETPAITTAATTSATSAPQPSTPAPAKKKSSLGKILLIAMLFIFFILAAAAGGGWYYLKHHVVVIANHTLTLMTPEQIAATQPTDQNAVPSTAQPADQSAAQSQSAPATPDQSQTIPAVTPLPATTPASPEVSTKKPAANNKKSAMQPVPAMSPMANNQSSPSASHTRIPSVNFDPLKLDPETNARLKIALSKFPAGLNFTVLMDGKILYTGASDVRNDYDKLVVPPGVHQMQLTVKSGKVSLISNIVSTEFVVQKHLTFKVEFRAPQSSGQPDASSLDPNTQLIAKLKTDFWQF